MHIAKKKKLPLQKKQKGEKYCIVKRKVDDFQKACCEEIKPKAKSENLVVTEMPHTMCECVQVPFQENEPNNSKMRAKIIKISIFSKSGEEMVF